MKKLLFIFIFISFCGASQNLSLSKMEEILVSNDFNYTINKFGFEYYEYYEYVSNDSLTVCTYVYSNNDYQNALNFIIKRNNKTGKWIMGFNSPSIEYLPTKAEFMKIQNEILNNGYEYVRVANPNEFKGALATLYYKVSSELNIILHLSMIKAGKEENYSIILSNYLFDWKCENCFTD